MLFQLHLLYLLNTSLQWIGHKQLQDEMRNIWVLEFDATYIRDFTVVCFILAWACRSWKWCDMRVKVPQTTQIEQLVQDDNQEIINIPNNSPFVVTIQHTGELKATQRTSNVGNIIISSYYMNLCNFSPGVSVLWLEIERSHACLCFREIIWIIIMNMIIDHMLHHVIDKEYSFWNPINEHI